MNRKRMALLGAVLLGAVGPASAQAPTPPPGFNIAETRQAGMDLLGGTFTGIIQGVRHKADVKAFEKPAAAMARWITQYPNDFPEGGEHGHKTRALPAIWSDRAGFEKAAMNLATASDKLSQLAKAADTEGFAAQVKVVGDACTACHDKFRAK